LRIALTMQPRKATGIVVGEGRVTAKARVIRAKLITHTKYVLDPEDAAEIVQEWAKTKPDFATSPRRLYDFACKNRAPGDLLPTKRDFQVYLNRPEPNRPGRRPRKSG
jgi:hypothetical protein